MMNHFYRLWYLRLFWSIKKEDQKQAGFSLLEVMIAIGILSLLMLSSTMLIQQSQITTLQMKNRTMATFYAQECLELTRNVRDAAWNQRVPWDCAFFPFYGTETGIAVDHSALNQSVCDAGGCTCETRLGSRLEYGAIDLGNGFERRLTFDPEPILPPGARAGEAESVTIHCEVAWRERGQKQVLTLSQTLTNWIKR